VGTARLVRAVEPVVLEPLHSLLVRELTILSRDFGQASRAVWEMSRALRADQQGLTGDADCGRMAPNKEDGMAAAPPVKSEESAYQSSFEEMT